METKQSARELLAKAVELLNHGKVSEQKKFAAMIDAHLAAPSESAMEAKQLARLLLSRTSRTYNQSGKVEILPAYSVETATELIQSRDAALIEGLQRRVPDNYLREEKELLAAKDEYIALLEKASGEGAMFAYIHGSHVPQADIDAGIRCRAKIAELSAKHSVVIE